MVLALFCDIAGTKLFSTMQFIHQPDTYGIPSSTY